MLKEVELVTLMYCNLLVKTEVRRNLYLEIANRHQSAQKCAILTLFSVTPEQCHFSSSSSLLFG